MPIITPWDNNLPIPLDSQATSESQKAFAAGMEALRQVQIGGADTGGFVRGQVQLTHLRQTELFNARAANSLLGTDRSPTYPAGLVPAAINPNPIFAGAGNQAVPVKS